MLCATPTASFMHRLRTFMSYQEDDEVKVQTWTARKRSRNDIERDEKRSGNEAETSSKVLYVQNVLRRTSTTGGASKTSHLALLVRSARGDKALRSGVMGYETSKLITSDTDLERGNAQRERWKIATTCWSPRVYVIQRTNGCGSA